MRWFPQPLEFKPEDNIDFVDGLRTMAGAGDAASKSGIAIHVYSCNANMEDTAMFNSDGDFLIVPQVGELHIQTEFGFLDVAPKEICVIQRGIRFRVAVDGPSRGYICELYTGHFQLPDLGPLGANGLANPRDFLAPVAAYEEREVDFIIVNKFGGKLFSALSKHSPFDVVAWHGNYCPYKYDLQKFNTMNSVSFDHPDPSIYTVLTCPSDTPGVAICDFVIFPPRWMVMDKTFRPPYYHRNVMTEFMGMVWGRYDAKGGGFQPGGASLHSCMTSHGPDAETFMKASHAELKPEKFDGGLAFMFETCHLLKLTDWALTCKHRDYNYQSCWQSLPKVFNPEVRDMATLTVRKEEEGAAGAKEGEGHATVGSGAGWVYGDGSSVERVGASSAASLASSSAAAASGSGSGGMAVDAAATASAAAPKAGSTHARGKAALAGAASGVAGGGGGAGSSDSNGAGDQVGQKRPRRE